MLPQLLLLFLFSVKLPLLSFLFKATSSPSQSAALFVFEDGLIIDVFETWDLIDEHFSVMGDLLVKLIVLQISDC